MDKNLLMASNKLRKIQINANFDDICIDVVWLRGMMLSQGASVGMHTHSTYEFHTVKQGACKVVTSNGEYIIHKGQTYITPPQMLHEQIAIGEEDYLEYCINCDIKCTDEGAINNNIINQLCNNDKFIVIADTQILERYYELVFDCINHMMALGVENIKHLVYIIINTMALMLEKNGKIAEHFDDEIDGRFNELNQYIIDNIDSMPKISEMSKMFFIDKKQIWRIFKKTTGKGTMAYITSLRINALKEYLEKKELAIKEIAEIMNFSSEQHLTAFFKKHTKKTPSEYRK